MMKNKNKKFLFDFGLHPCDDANETGSSSNGVHASRSILYTLIGIACFGLILVAIVLASLTKRECASQTSKGCVEVTPPLVHEENQHSVMALMRYTQKPTQVGTAAISHDGRLLAVNLGNTNIWEVATGRCLQSYKHIGGPDDAIALSSDGKYLACAETSNICVWDTTSKKQIVDLPSSEYQELKPGMPAWRATKLDFSPDGKTLAVVIKGEHDFVLLLSIPDGRREAILPVETKASLKKVRYDAKAHWLLSNLRDVQFSPNGRCLLVTGTYWPKSEDKIGGWRGRLSCWDSTTWQRKWQQDTEFWPEEIVFSPDGNTVVLGKIEDGVRSVKDGRLIGNSDKFYAHGTLSPSAFSYPPGSLSPLASSYPSSRLLPLAFSPDSSHLVRMDCNNVSIYSMADLHAPVRTFPIQYALCARYSADGKELLTLNCGGALERWNVETCLCTYHMLVDAERHVESTPWVVKAAQNGD